MELSRRTITVADATLEQPPFNLDDEPLVTGSVEVHSERLKATISWLVRCIQGQQRAAVAQDKRVGIVELAIDELEGRSKESSRAPSRGGQGLARGLSFGADAPAGFSDAATSAGQDLEPGAVDAEAGPASPLDGSSRRLTTRNPMASGELGESNSRKSMALGVREGMRSNVQEELLALQIESLRQELNARPTTVDMERQRELVLSRMTSMASDLTEKTRMINDRMQEQLSTATGQLRDQLARVTAELFEKLQFIDDLVHEKIDFSEAEEGIEAGGDSPSVPSAVVAPAANQGESSDVACPISPTAAVDSPRATSHRSELSDGTQDALQRAVAKMREDIKEELMKELTNMIGSSNSVAEGISASQAVENLRNEVMDWFAAHVPGSPKMAEMQGPTSFQQDTCVAIAGNSQQPKQVDHSFTFDSQTSMPTLPPAASALEPPVVSSASAEGGTGASAEESPLRSTAAFGSLESPSRFEDNSGTRAVAPGNCSSSPDVECLRNAIASVEAGAAVAVSRLLSLEARIDHAEHRAGSVEEVAAALDERVSVLEGDIEDLKTASGPGHALQLEQNIGALDARSSALESWRGNIEAKEKTAALTAPGGGAQFSAVQAELERLRQLFEFVRGVLPKDSAEQMEFFMGKDRAGAKDGAEPSAAAGPVTSALTATDLDKQRGVLEEVVKNSEEALRAEFDKLSTMLKVLQRDEANTKSRVNDLAKRLSAGGAAPASGMDPFKTSDYRPPSTAGSAGSPRPRDLSHLLLEDEKVHQRDFVTKGSLDSALSGIRQDCRQWLDGLNQGLLAALQSKADIAEVSLLSDHVRQAAAVLRSGSGNHEAEKDTAAFAKRRLAGHCASCDAPLDTEALNWKNPPPQSAQGFFSSNNKSPVSIRTPGLGVPPATAPSGQAPKCGSSKLPKLADFRRDFPQRQIRKNRSTPQLQDRSAESSTLEDLPG